MEGNLAGDGRETATIGEMIYVTEAVEEVMMNVQGIEEIEALTAI